MAKPDLFQICLCLRQLPAVFPLRKGRSYRQPNVFERGKPRQQRIILKYNSCLIMNTRNLLSVDPYVTRIGAQQSGRDV